MRRRRTSEATETAVLMKSRRRCCLCYFLDRNEKEVEGQIAHLDRDHANSAEDNLAYLCLAHHNRYDSRTSQSKGYKESEVRQYRDRLYEIYASAAPVANATPAPPAPPPFAAYVEDTFFEITWRWKWHTPANDDAEPVRIKPFCPRCDIELKLHRGSWNFGPGPNRGAKWNCTECHSVREGHDETEVAKRIMAKIRSGEWKSLLK